MDNPLNYASPETHRETPVISSLSPEAREHVAATYRNEYSGEPQELTGFWNMDEPEPGTTYRELWIDDELINVSLFRETPFSCPCCGEALEHHTHPLPQASLKERLLNSTSLFAFMYERV